MGGSRFKTSARLAIGVSTRTLKRWVAGGEFPEPRAVVADVMDGLADAAVMLEPLLEPLGAALEALMGVFRIQAAFWIEAALAALQKLVPGMDSLASRAL